MGDGALCEFPSVVDTVACAVAVSRALFAAILCRIDRLRGPPGVAA
jgi:hypothetical protein